MNSVIIENFNKDNKLSFELSKAQSIHLLEIVKVKVGDKLKATILNDCLATIEITKIHDSEKSIWVQILDKKPGINYPITLIIGASRPQTMKKVIEHGTSMGVNEFIIVGTSLTEKSYLSAKIYEKNEFSELATLGLSQSAVFYKMPKISLCQNLKNLPSFSTSKNYILSPYTHNNILNENIISSHPITLAIGPERGWTQSELNYFTDKGFRDVCLSASILRVENAALSTLGILNAKFLG